MSYYISYVVVDLFVDHCIANKVKEFTAWTLNQWVKAHKDPLVTPWKGQASYLLQEHSKAQAANGGTGTRHRVYCSRRGPWAPWVIEHDGSWEKALNIKLLQVTRDTLVHNSRQSLAQAKAEDARHGHVKAKVSSPDGPVLTACKDRIRQTWFGLNATLVVSGLKPVDVEKMLARF